MLHEHILSLPHVSSLNLMESYLTSLITNLLLQLLQRKTAVPLGHKDYRSAVVSPCYCKSSQKVIKVIVLTTYRLWIARQTNGYIENVRGNIALIY